MSRTLIKITFEIQLPANVNTSRMSEKRTLLLCQMGCLSFQSRSIFRFVPNERAFDSPGTFRRVVHTRPFDNQQDIPQDSVKVTETNIKSFLPLPASRQHRSSPCPFVAYSYVTGPSRTLMYMASAGSWTFGIAGWPWQLSVFLKDGFYSYRSKEYT